MVSIPDFWRLAVESRLLTLRDVEALQNEFAHVKGAAQQGNAGALIEWLVARKALTRYQTRILGAGRSGPFFYGDYKVDDRLESGRLAAMFRAHSSLGHPVLLQFLTGAITQDPARWSAAVARAGTCFGWQHPHLVQVHELVDLVSFKFLVLEDLRGRTLAEHLAEHGRLSPADACRLTRQAALALAYLHRQGQPHGDLRAEQVWLTADGHLKLLVDALLAPQPPKFGGADERPEMQSLADYLAPEFTRPGKMPDAQTDIYALGCLLYQMLTGQPPFAGGDVTSKLQRHAKQPIAPLEPYGVPQPVAQVVAYMMAKNPAVRFPQAELVAERLVPLIDPAQLQAAPQAPATLAAFQAALRQKRAAAPPQAARVASGGGGSEGPPGGFPAVHAGQRPGSTEVAVSSAAPAASGIPVVSHDAAAGTGSLAARTSRGRQNKPLIVGAALGGAAAVLILLLIVINGAGTNSRETVAGGPDSGTGVGGNPDAVAGGGAGTGSATFRPAVSSTGGTGGPVTSTGGTSAGPGTSGRGAADDGAVEAQMVRQTVVPDDGKLLWASPTSGTPIALNHFPPGPQVFLAVRPAELLQTEQGSRVLESLGPQFAAYREAWERAAGVTWEQIEQLTVGLYDNGEQLPRPYYAVTLRELVEPQALLSGWGNPAPVESDKGTYYKGAASCFLIPAGSGTSPGPTFLMGDEAEIKLAAEFGGAVPPLRTGMEPLLAASDRNRHATLLFAPSYLSSTLFHDGRSYYFGKPTSLRQSIEWLAGDDVQASLVSLHLDDPFYWEIRLFSSLNRDQYSLASDLRDRIAQVPESIERYIVGLNPHPYWRMVAFRYPSMIRFLHDQTRVGVEDRQAVINGVLPGAAAHNLVFGGEMILGAGPSVVTVAANPQPTGPQTLDEVLGLKMDLMFDQTSLEFSMRDLAADVNETHKPSFDFEIKIIGDDLKLEGITRNQQIRDFAQQGKSVGDILTALVMKANPVTTVQKPSETDQKLIWVIGPDPDNPSRKIVLITTRTAAGTRNYDLPAPFRPET